MIATKKTVLKFDQVSFGYENNGQLNKILNDVSFSAKEGEFISIVGVSGSGKSTIFRLIVGLEQPDHGKIYVNGKSMKNRLGKIGYMPQEDLLMPWRTVKENAILPLEIHKQRKIEKKIVNELLDDFGLKGYEDNYPHELSGGMRQRVSFLRATLSGSNVLLLDEPFSALDAMTKLFMQEWLLKKWEKQQSTILFITHDISEALFLSDRIFIITETPFTTLEEVQVPLDRPRKQKNMDLPDVISLKNSLIERFRMRV